MCRSFLWLFDLFCSRKCEYGSGVDECQLRCVRVPDIRLFVRQTRIRLHRSRRRHFHDSSAHCPLLCALLGTGFMVQGVLPLPLRHPPRPRPAEIPCGACPGNASTGWHQTAPCSRGSEAGMGRRKLPQAPDLSRATHLPQAGRLYHAGAGSRTQGLWYGLLHHSEARGIGLARQA